MCGLYNFFFGKKRKIDNLLLLRKNIELNLRTFTSKIQTTQTAFETLRDQNEEVIQNQAQTIKLLKELIEKWDSGRKH